MANRVKPHDLHCISVSVSIPRNFLDAIEELAQEECTTRSNIIMQAIRYYEENGYLEVVKNGK